MGDLPLNALLSPAAGASMRNALAPEPVQYQTQVAPEQAAAFNAYVANLARLQKRPVESVMRDVEDYDLQGAFQSGFKPDARGHLGDRYKKPNHPTFSDQSQYHGVEGNVGGTWLRANGRDVFQAGPTNVQNMGGVQGLQDYFRKYEPGVQLVLPAPFPGY
jgi:hypothetical protein